MRDVGVVVCAQSLGQSALSVIAHARRPSVRRANRRAESCGSARARRNGHDARHRDARHRHFGRRSSGHRRRGGRDDPRHATRADGRPDRAGVACGVDRRRAERHVERRARVVCRYAADHRNVDSDGRGTRHRATTYSRANHSDRRAGLSVCRRRILAGRAMLGVDCDARCAGYRGARRGNGAGALYPRHRCESGGDSPCWLALESAGFRGVWILGIDGGDGGHSHQLERAQRRRQQRRPAPGARRDSRGDARRHVAARRPL
ncbi:conserved hypothetical protein [Paraburkholderia graminis C4D1M]|uniref:Uncharacterized protein n=1 Tax=Paraburkholderia graminis (strain ATCC 700544 / DSM 17151 / LMG 18924 / NCIMB 13744 / C4D1M) TaxID=396598 RepID=B1GBE6_PARG4|nr:conserved hypothetical protein [Paraburkholderia graminis C4D1M]